jgi:hypothetical protein
LDTEAKRVEVSKTEVLRFAQNDKDGDGCLRCRLLRAAAAAGGLGAGNAPALALGDEVAALLDLAEDAIALDCLPEAREQMLWGLAVSKVN